MIVVVLDVRKLEGPIAVDARVASVAVSVTVTTTVAARVVAVWPPHSSAQQFRFRDVRCNPWNSDYVQEQSQKARS